MDNTQHHEECTWNLKGIKKTKNWYLFLNIKSCPVCKAEVEVTDELA